MAKTALITGAGSGIGCSFATLLLAKAYNVIIADLALRPESQTLIDRYTDSPKAIFVQTDVSNWKALRELFDIAEKKFPEGLDIVSPGAGILEPTWSNSWNPPGSESSRDDIFGDRYKTMDVNLVHPIRMTQLAIEHWKKIQWPLQTTKHILHITSIAGHNAVFSSPIYAATKHGLSGFVRSMAPLIQLGIKVTAVAPGVVKTPLWLEDASKMESIDENIGVWVLPEEVAKVMAAMIEEEKIDDNILKDNDKSANPVNIPIYPGIIVQVSKIVQEIVGYNEPPPTWDAGCTLSDQQQMAEETLERLRRGGAG
ncbi:hypothetical protein KEM54_000688 [Ascosphaera aggregata]|nr:hypothetical protein KEM54_000688 [Ascosphaera aggregata]